MKKFISTFIFILSFCSLFSQVITIEVRNVQNFEHPIMQTNRALKENKVNYFESGVTDSKYVFDLNKMKLYRNMDGLVGEFDIITKHDDKSILNVVVKFTNGQIANYILQQEDDGKKTLICRWGESNKIVGWFDRTI